MAKHDELDSKQRQCDPTVVWAALQGVAGIGEVPKDPLGSAGVGKLRGIDVSSSIFDCASKRGIFVNI